jgi:hypothetical protein
MAEREIAVIVLRTPNNSIATLREMANPIEGAYRI